ncbi:hypothetical protein Tco_1525665 [Tanacetum coccineum]
MDHRGEKGIPRYEAMHHGAVNANRAKTKIRTNNVSLRSHISGQCSPTNRKRFTADANLLHQLRPASSETFDINYRPRTAIRGQVLADFIAKRPDEDGAQTKVHVKEIIPDHDSIHGWILMPRRVRGWTNPHKPRKD